MKWKGTQATELHSLLADEINAINQYVACSKTSDNSNHADLHKAILGMYNDFPGWLQQRIITLDHAMVTRTTKKG